MMHIFARQLPFALKLVAIGALLVGCVSAQRPYSFSVPHAQGDLNAAVRALAAEGYAAQVIDEQAGVVHTEWKESGDYWGGKPVVQRYTIVVNPVAGAGAQVIVRAERKACEQYAYEIVGPELQGSCESADYLTGGQQQELEALGERVRAAMQARPIEAHSPTAPS